MVKCENDGKWGLVENCRNRIEFLITIRAQKAQSKHKSFITLHSIPIQLWMSKHPVELSKKVRMELNYSLVLETGNDMNRGMSISRN